ncbi:unnamed protein product [Microthlaspi erraticum]|uniref:Uncharacterized protein n=1 Tax=Microthlaspi erraticum TaxID=1685480 RepID=A0A6D2JU44_9BRAS|nr:unnamed protein product [Microthlaspi erraticum]
MLPSRAQAPHRIVLYDSRAQTNNLAKIEPDCNETDGDTTGYIATTLENPPIQANAEPAWKSDLRFKALLDLDRPGSPQSRNRSSKPSTDFCYGDPRRSSVPARNKRKSSSSRPEKSTHKAPSAITNLSLAETHPVYDDETRRNWRIARRLIAMHPQCSFSIRRYSRSLPIFEELP